jgi:hypothetical protein
MHTKTQEVKICKNSNHQHVIANSKDCEREE